MKTLIIVGSSRRNGNTTKTAAFLSELLNCAVLNLSDYEFSYYDYQARNKDDDFIKIAERLQDFDRLIFATPVYWYAMSGIMKVFLDRFSDLLTLKKSLGRSLAGKRMDLLACSSDDQAYEWFEKPFKATAEYLDMTFGLSVHTWIENDVIPDSVKVRLASLVID